jgi:hypothetical protein
MPPDMVLSGLLSHIEADGLALCVANRDTGEGWVSGDLHACLEPPEISTVRIEVHGDPALVGAMVTEVEADDYSGRVKSADTVLILTLHGADVNWPIVRKVWNAIETQWPTAVHDDGSGFGLSIEELG